MTSSTITLDIIAYVYALLQITFQRILTSDVLECRQVVELPFDCIYGYEIEHIIEGHIYNEKVILGKLR